MHTVRFDPAASGAAQPAAMPRLAPHLRAHFWASRHEVEALHRVLFPGWRGAILDWLRTKAEAKVEDRYRGSWEKDAEAARGAFQNGPTDTRQFNVMPRRNVLNATALLATLKRLCASPPDPGWRYGLPEGLTAEMLEWLAMMVQRKAGKGAGYTPEVAAQKAAEWAEDPRGYRVAAAAEGERKMRAKETRRKREPAKKKARKG